MIMQLLSLLLLFGTIVYFTANITMILIWYCEDNKLPDKDILLLSLFFGFIMLLLAIIETFEENREKRIRFW